ncbi:helix-turn-helix domain-containing protein [Streptomyces chiangmaiensis]|uniref:helix-turn-helix domain-containing protein n=1 Tax=Streptomyces chiangmaiensis TaxID=766497 RepID=UPI003CD069C6
MEQAAELRELVSSRGVPSETATRGRIVLRSAERRRRKDIAELLGASLPTADRWKLRYAEHSLAGTWGIAAGADWPHGQAAGVVSPDFGMWISAWMTMRRRS